MSSNHDLLLRPAVPPVRTCHFIETDSVGGCTGDWGCGVAVLSPAGTRLQELHPSRRVDKQASPNLAYWKDIQLRGAQEEGSAFPREAPLTWLDAHPSQHSKLPPANGRTSSSFASAAFPHFGEDLRLVSFMLAFRHPCHLATGDLTIDAIGHRTMSIGLSPEHTHKL